MKDEEISLPMAALGLGLMIGLVIFGACLPFLMLALGLDILHQLLGHHPLGW